jgi:acyl-coenzyme A synthetase/AMP-(fatty) acid ligase
VRRAPPQIEAVEDQLKTLTGKIRRVELREAEREKKRALAGG